MIIYVGMPQSKPVAGTHKKQQDNSNEYPKPIFEPRCEKTGLRCFPPGPTQTRLHNHRRWLVTLNFGFRQ